MSSIIRFLGILCSIVLLSSCAVRTEVQKVSVDDIRANLKYENVIFRNFTALPGVPYPEVSLLECMGTAIDYLKMKTVFKNIDRDSNKSIEGSTLFVDVTLTDLRIVSGAARAWAGAMAGRSHMKIVAKLIDANGSLIAEQELFGAPNAYGSAYSMGHSDRELARNMGVLLGDYILANASKK